MGVGVQGCRKNYKLSIAIASTLVDSSKLISHLEMTFVISLEL